MNLHRRYRKSMILSNGFIDTFENHYFSFFFDDTSSEKRRGTKMKGSEEGQKSVPTQPNFHSGPRWEHQISGARVIRAKLKSRCDDPVERGRGEVNLSPENWFWILG